MAKIAAKNCRVKSGSTIFRAMKFSADPKVQKLDGTDFESGGFGEYQDGIADCDLSFSFYYDDAALVLATFIPGSLVPIEVDLKKDGSKKFLATMYVEHAPHQGDVRGWITVEVVGCSSGSYTYPT